MKTLTENELLVGLEEADCIRFINYYEEDQSKRTKCTIGLWSNEHPLAELAKDFHKKCIEYLKQNPDK